MERKYNMCDVALPAMSGRALATLVSAEVHDRTERGCIGSAIRVT